MAPSAAAKFNLFPGVEKTRLSLLCSRVRALGWLVVFSTAAFTALARLLEGPPAPGVYAIVGLELVAAIALIVAAGQAASENGLSAIGVGLVVTVYLGCVGSTLSGEAVHTVAIVFCAVSVGTAALWPWAARFQVVSVALGAAVILVTQYFLSTHAGSHFPMAEVAAMAVTALGSIYVVAQFERQRGRAEADRQALERAYAELTLANARLERRVADRTSDLEAMIRDLTTVSHSVSHDLRAPLRTLDGFSQILAEDFGSELSPQAKEWLSGLRAASRRFDHLIDEMLLLVRVARGDCVKGEVDLSDIAHTLVEDLRRKDPGRDIVVEIEAGVSVLGDRSLLVEALRRLLGNAWRFTGGKADARIQFGSARSDGCTVYFVKDNGVGFSPEQAGSLFEAFTRFHAGSALEGTGMGLAAVRRIIERHDGRIWAEGEPGRGASFFFTLHTETADSESAACC